MWTRLFDRARCGRVLGKSRTALVSLAAVSALFSSPSQIAPAFLRDHVPAFLATGVATAKDVAELHRDLGATGSDYRLRVSAALALGQMGRRESIGPLVKALDDPHPAVRAAASAALSKIGDPSAAGAVEAAAGRESVASVKAQHQATVAKLRGGSVSSSAKFVVKMGTFANRTSTKSPEAEKVFRDATRANVLKVPGALVPGDREDASSIGKAKSLPVVAIDGTISKLNSVKTGGEVGWDAQVEYLIKQLPDQSLKSTIKGRSKALVSAGAVKNASDDKALQVDAVNAAVESALGDAGRALNAATR
jgi:hypothetical protein